MGILRLCSRRRRFGFMEGLRPRRIASSLVLRFGRWECGGRLLSGFRGSGSFLELCVYFGDGRKEYRFVKQGNGWRREVGDGYGKADGEPDSRRKLHWTGHEG